MIVIDDREETYRTFRTELAEIYHIDYAGDRRTAMQRFSQNGYGTVILDQNLDDGATPEESLYAGVAILKFLEDKRYTPTLNIFVTIHADQTELMHTVTKYRFCGMVDRNTDEEKALINELRWLPASIEERRQERITVSDDLLLRLYTELTGIYSGDVTGNLAEQMKKTRELRDLATQLWQAAHTEEPGFRNLCHAIYTARSALNVVDLTPRQLQAMIKVMEHLQAQRDPDEGEQRRLELILANAGLPTFPRLDETEPPATSEGRA